MNEDEYWDKRKRQWQHGRRAKRDIDYFMRAPLDQLEEWNEGHVAQARNFTMMWGDLGVMSTMEFRMGYVIFGDDELLEIKWETMWTQLCAVFGDDDMLMRLVIFHDDPGTVTGGRTQEYIDAALRR